MEWFRIRAHAISAGSGGGDRLAAVDVWAAGPRQISPRDTPPGLTGGSRNHPLSLLSDRVGAKIRPLQARRTPANRPRAKLWPWMLFFGEMGCALLRVSVQPRLALRIPKLAWTPKWLMSPERDNRRDGTLTHDRLDDGHRTLNY
jgi:hypothetical protein